ncbi:unnamed protein product [Camellia sinensis]
MDETSSIMAAFVNEGMRWILHFHSNNPVSTDSKRVLINWMFLHSVCFCFCIWGIHLIPSLTNAAMMLLVSSISFTLYTSTFIRAFLLFLSHLEEGSKLFVKLLMGVIFIVCQLKIVLNHDTLGAPEEIAMGYLRISIEMMRKCHADMSVLCALPCLLGFLPLFLPPTTDRIDEQLGANFPEMDREGNHQL